MNGKKPWKATLNLTCCNLLFCLLETKQPVQEDKLTLKKVIDLVNKHDDQNLKEMNRKLQNVLEETLTKNMHLQEVRLFSKIYNRAQFLLIQVQLFLFQNLSSLFFSLSVSSLWFFFIQHVWRILLEKFKFHFKIFGYEIAQFSYLPALLYNSWKSDQVCSVHVKYIHWKCAFAYWYRLFPL